MHIDFHHPVTYVCARAAGFDPEDAEIVAHCAQYVDDATTDGIVRFDNGALYARSATAHRMLDYKNFQALPSRLVWVPFHFVPGNGGLRCGDAPDGGFIERMITRPGSPVVEDMVRAAIVSQDRPYGLYRLGVVAHVYADTWAHQGFAGVSHEVNRVSEVERDGKKDPFFERKVTRFFEDVMRRTMQPLGHGEALTYPDLPFLVWSYTDGHGRRIERDNAAIFVDAADALCRAFRRYLARDADLEVEGLPDGVRGEIEKLFRGLTETKARPRYLEWLRAVRDDRFGVGSRELPVLAKGVKTWKDQALNPAEPADSRPRVYRYSEDFMNSHWKRFHDAAKAHRRSTVDDILPRYGILAA
ncbi:MAG: DUF6765 family protein [Myxococcota bacterium]